MSKCKSVGCFSITQNNHDFCTECESDFITNVRKEVGMEVQTMSQKYPKYYKSVGELTEIDVYATHFLFNIQDPSGCIQHASKKLLLSGVRTGGKSVYQDIKEARDTLNRWLELNEQSKPE